MITATTGGNSDGDSDGNYSSNETAVLNAIEENNKVTAQQIFDSTEIPKRTIERILKLHRDKGVLIREGTKNGKWIML